MTEHHSNSAPLSREIRETLSRIICMPDTCKLDFVKALLRLFGLCFIVTISCHFLGQVDYEGINIKGGVSSDFPLNNW